MQAAVLQVWLAQSLAAQQVPVTQMLLQQTCPAPHWLVAVQPQAPLTQTRFPAHSLFGSAPLVMLV